MYMVQDYGLKVRDGMSVRTSAQTRMCRDGVALLVILPMYEVLLYDNGGQDTSENWDCRGGIGGLTYES